MTIQNDGTIAEKIRRNAEKPKNYHKCGRVIGNGRTYETISINEGKL